MKDGKHYPPNTLHQLCCGVLRRFHSSLGIFKNPEFEELRKTLNAEMKRLRRAPGMPVGQKQAEAHQWGGGRDAMGEGGFGFSFSPDPCRHHGLHSWVVLRSALW